MNIVEVYRRFPAQADCLAYLEKVRWNGKPVCPYCKSLAVTSVPKEDRHHCNNCNTSFSVTVGTIFHKTKVDIQKWFLAISIILNAKKGISARQLARDLNVHRNTAWYMAMRIRKAMFENRRLLEGIVEMDESYVGGKPRRFENKIRKSGRGTDKTPVVGMVERGGDVYAQKVDKLTFKKLSKLVRDRVNLKDTILVTDEYHPYRPMESFIDHAVINHSKAYVQGAIHTNTIEGFWALLKRGIVGQYHKVSTRHLDKYIREFCYRYNHRADIDLFSHTIKQAVGVIK